MPVDRSAAEVLGAHKDVVKQEIRKCLPATITAVHADRQTVDVQIAVNDQLFDDIGTAWSVPAPGLADVPLAVPRGGGFFVWMPVAVGDSVLLVFSDLSCDTWRAGDGSPNDPGWMGQHTMDSPFAIPCCAPDKKFFGDPSGDPGKVIIGQDGSQSQIRVSSSDIELGVGATEFVALADKVSLELSKIATTLGTGVANLTTGNVVFGTPYVPGAVSATLVKAK